MRIIQGHFNGTGADVYLCLGVLPYNIVMWGLDDATVETYEWDRAMLHEILTVEGISRPKAGGAVEDHAFGEGIAPYRGGELLTTTNQTSTTYGEGVFLERDDTDYRYFTDSAVGISGDAATETIDTWTLETAATPTGMFNADATGTYIGKGSAIRIIDDSNKHTYDVCITADLSTAGGATNEVTLSEAVPSGTVTFIGGKHGYKPMAVGKVTKAGVFISNTTLNSNDGRVGFRAICP